MIITIIVANDNDDNTTNNNHNNDCTRRGARAELHVQRCTRGRAWQRLGFSKG